MTNQDFNTRVNTLIMRGLSSQDAIEQAVSEAGAPETYERSVARQALRTTSPIVRTTGRPFMAILADALGGE